MSGIEAHISGSEKLIVIHGRWPAFHDAEIIELHLSRGDILTRGSEAVSLFVKIHVCIEASGTKPALATLRFVGVEKLVLTDFNHQNAIFSLVITRQERRAENGTPLPLQFVVVFNSAHGMASSFLCDAISVLDALPLRES